MVPFGISFVLLLTLTMLYVWIIIAPTWQPKLSHKLLKLYTLLYMSYSIYLPCTSGSSKSPKSYSQCLNICLDCVKKPADLNSIRDVLKKTHLFSEIKLLRWLSVSGKKRSVLLSSGLDVLALLSVKWECSSCYISWWAWPMESMAKLELLYKVMFIGYIFSCFLPIY